VLVFWHPVLYAIAVMLIGARQHALIILGHTPRILLPAEAMAERALRQPLLDVAGVRLDRGISQVSLDASPIHKPSERWESPHLVHP
jgi:hypothetical protein